MRLCRNRCAVTTSVLKLVSQNTAPHTLHWNIVKTSRWWCLGFNWISRKISRKRRIREGGELTKGRNGQLPTVNVYSQFVMSVLAAWFIVVQILMTICISLWCLYWQHGSSWFRSWWRSVCDVCIGSMVHRGSDLDDDLYPPWIHQRYCRHPHLGSDIKDRQVWPRRETCIIP